MRRFPHAEVTYEYLEAEVTYEYLEAEVTYEYAEVLLHVSVLTTLYVRMHFVCVCVSE